MSVKGLFGTPSIKYDNGLSLVTVIRTAAGAVELEVIAAEVVDVAVVMGSDEVTLPGVVVCASAVVGGVEVEGATGVVGSPGVVGGAMDVVTVEVATMSSTTAHTYR